MDVKTQLPVDAVYKQAIGHFNAKRYTEADKLCTAILKTKPDHIESCNMLGIIALKLGEFKLAAEQFKKVLKVNNRLAPIHRHLGLSLRQLGDNEGAMVAFQAALELDKNDIVSQREIKTLLKIRKKNAENIKQKEELKSSITKYRKVAIKNPKCVATLCKLGSSLIEDGKYSEAIVWSRKALAIDKNLHEAHTNLGDAYRKTRRPMAAIEHYKNSLIARPHDLGVMTTLIILFESINNLESVEDLFNEVKKTSPDKYFTSYMSALLLLRKGDALGAAKEISCYTENTAPTIDLLIGFFLAGKIYDRIGRHDDAFQQFETGNRLQSQSKEQLPFRKERWLSHLDHVMQSLSPSWVESWSPDLIEPDLDSPVFLLGFPRSGTTLLDQILDAHPLVSVMDEQPIFNKALSATFINPSGHRSDPTSVVKETDIPEIRKRYHMMSNQIMPRESGVILVDKHPLATQYVPLISRVFPKARIIFALRHPCDVVLSCFMQSFIPSDNMVNFFSIADTANAYVKVMNIWLQSLQLINLNYHIVKYESLVENQEIEINKLLDFLGLEVDPGVYTPHLHAKNRQHPPTTSSYAQVTEPVYQRAKYRWENYKDKFKPVMEELAPFIKAFGYEGETSSDEKL